MRPRVLLWSIVSIVCAATAARADLSVGWIGREPKIAYVWASANPAREGWPAEGQQVTWVAHVWNVTGAAQENIGYRWSIDGLKVAEGTVTLAPGETRIELPWTWTFARHEIALEIDTAARVQESVERNNRLLIHSDALGVGIYVEQGFWDGIRPTIGAAGIRAVTFADWMQLRIRQFNAMAALARYDETPHGVLDRWRIDEIHIVPDGALPLVRPGSDVRDWGAGEASWPTLYPDSSDRTVDMQWGFPTSALAAYAGREAWPLLYDSFLHELGHARTLIDVYAWRLDGTDRVEIPGLPSDGFGNHFITREWGMMNTQWGFLGRYDAIVLNRMAGQRAREGNFNEPWDLGRFLNDLPAQNRLRLVDRDGNPVAAGLTVRIYFASSRLHPDWRSAPYEILIDALPDLVLTTDEQGSVLVGPNPFSDGPLSILVDRTNVLSVLEVVGGGTSRWGYLESSQFNLAYWRGQTGLAEHTIQLDPPLCYPAGVGSLTFAPKYEALVTTPEVTFEFVRESRHSYELWWSINEGPPQKIDVAPRFIGGVNSVKVRIPGDGRVAWWYIDRNPNAAPECPPHKSAIYFFDLETARTPRRRAVGK